MRILYFSQGSTVHDRHFLQLFAEGGHQVFFLSLTPLEDAAKRQLPRSITCLSWPAEPPGTTRSAAALRAFVPDLDTLVRKIQPDLIHAGPIQSCGFMAALLDFHPLVLMSWGYDILLDMDRSAQKRWQTHVALARADLFVCDCQAVRIRAEPLLPRGKIVQFPWGIDLKRFHPKGSAASFRTEQGWQDCFVLISNRRWEPVYGIETLLEGFRSARQQDSRLRLLLIGNGSLAEQVHQVIRAYDLKTSIFCPGPISHAHLPSYYRAADLYVSCSRIDGSSVSLLEAMGCALPVVVTESGGNPEWVRPDEGGVLFPVDDSSELARQLVRLAGMDRQYLRNMGRQGRRLVEEKADWTANRKKLLDIIETIKPRHGVTLLRPASATGG